MNKLNIMKKLVLVFCLLSFVFAKAQQIPLSSLYSYNKMMINPAETGIKAPSYIYLGHRQQWLGFEGAPVTTSLSGQTKLNNSMGFGGGIVLDKMSFLNRLNINLNYSYKVKFNKDHSTRFGLSLGMLQSTVNTANVITDDYSDALLANPSMNSLGVDANFGILYTYKNDLHIGLTFPQLINKKAANSINEQYDLAGHWIIYASYDAEIDEQFDLMPTLLMRNADKGNRQVELIANIKYNDKIWGGIGIRQGGGFLINAGAAIKTKFGITYSYEFDQAGVANSTAGTHELMLSFRFGKEPLIEDPEGDIQEPVERAAPSKRF